MTRNICERTLRVCHLFHEYKHKQQPEKSYCIVLYSYLIQNTNRVPTLQH